MKRLLSITISATITPLFLASLSTAADPDLEPRWGRDASPVPEGARVTLKLDKNEYTIGEIISMVFVLENAGSVPFTFEVGGDYRGTGFPLRYKVVAKDEKGEVMPDITKFAMDMGGISGPRELKPGEKYEETLPLLSYTTLAQPGIYTLGVAHDFSWKATPERKHPWAHASFTLVLPTPEQARNMVAQACAQGIAEYPPKTVTRFLRHPVFLPALTTLAEQGNAAAIQGIGAIHTPESTEVLVKLLENDSAVKAALEQLLPRLPMATIGKYSNPVYHTWHNASDPMELSKVTWKQKFGAEVLAASKKFLQSKDVDLVTRGALILTSLGQPGDMPAIHDALVPELSVRLPLRKSASDNILNHPGAQDTLLRAVDALRTRGYRAPTDAYRDTADLLILMRQLADADIPKPSGGAWKARLRTAMEDPCITLREEALRAVPSPIPADWVDQVKQHLEDDDLGVVREACEAAGRSKNDAFLKPLLQIVEVTDHVWVLRSASNAAWELGARVDLWNIWARRLAEKELFSDALDNLRNVFQEVADKKAQGHGSNNNMSMAERFALRDRWLAFLQKHEKELASGKRFSIQHPEIRPLCVLPGNGLIIFNLHLSDGTQWPVEKEK